MHTVLPIVVVGGGHAGVEAAAAAARMGADVVLVTLRADALVRLSCNPAIGGIGKAHLVREIDALGGLMGFAADLAGIHFRVLNRSRGPAVHGPRVQQDHDAYPEVVTRLVEQLPQITIVEGEAAAIRVEGGRLRAVVLADGREISAAAAVVTTGTFLRGKLFRGEEVTPGGRVGEPPADCLADGLRSLGLRLDRFKTGTPPRLLASSIDFAAFEEQPSDPSPEPLSFVHLGMEFTPLRGLALTHIAHTNETVHAVVRKGLDRSPLYTGRIDALGPRYCPSFEDKVVKFAEKPSHLLHLEPMGLGHPWIYVNGLSTSLPEDLQAELVHAIPGLEKAEIARFGYAVAYDFAPPTQLTGALGVRGVTGLFLAGQICGTTGYEEAAGLGLVAGANAVLAALGRDPWIPDRLSSYLGVMVDDLTTRGVLEPYRMFTSRAEARLSLAPDTADRRLHELGARLRLLPTARVEASRRRWERIERARAILERGTPLEANAGTPAAKIRRGEEFRAVLSRHLPKDLSLGRRDEETLAALVLYRGYLEREGREIERLRGAERVRIPSSFDPDLLPGLSNEVRQRLREVKPTSLGQAARIPGVTPAALGLLAAAVAAKSPLAS